ncbi:MAG: nucleotidyltransferase domain-containing protein [Desulfobacca sp.]|nr:nucleotidyltransferase domain-containing protein [Desulfobacca sp.]
MNKNLQGSIKDIINELEGEIQPQRIILFGSQASGKVDEYSDLDLLIIAPSQDRPLDRRLKVRRLLIEYDRNIGLDILFYTPEELALLENEPASFLRQLLASGITVYDQKNL